MSDSASHPPPIPWLDEQQPHEEAHSRAQIDALCRLVSPAPRRVLDVGCGAGRVLVPLAEAGHELTGVDRNGPALAACRARLDRAGAGAVLREADFLDPDGLPAGPFHAALCLGNTMMTIADVDDAIGLLKRVAHVLAPGGLFIIDDCPADFWPELIEGNWVAGLSEDGRWQMVWERADAVFTLRQGQAVDRESWGVRADEQRFRLWTDGSLRLAAQAAGLSGPRRLDPGYLLVMRLPGPPDPAV